MNRPDFGERCAELMCNLMDRIHARPQQEDARAALAAPQQEAPSNGQIVDLANDHLGFDLSPDEEEGVIEFARAFLARYGAHPVPVREAVDFRAKLAPDAYIAFVQICKGNSDDAGTYVEDEELVRRALKRLDELESAALAAPQPFIAISSNEGRIGRIGWTNQKMWGGKGKVWWSDHWPWTPKVQP